MILTICLASATRPINSALHRDQRLISIPQNGQPPHSKHNVAAKRHRLLGDWILLRHPCAPPTVGLATGGFHNAGRLSLHVRRIQESLCRIVSVVRKDVAIMTDAASPDLSGLPPFHETEHMPQHACKTHRAGRTTTREALVQSHRLCRREARHIERRCPPHFRPQADSNGSPRENGVPYKLQSHPAVSAR